jgi:hypothetical protein
MTNEHDEPPKSLLGSLPRTDPAVLKAMVDGRVANAHYSAIGQVAASWAFLEYMIDVWLWTLLDRPYKMTVCLTGQLMGSRPSSLSDWGFGGGDFSGLKRVAG